MHLIKYQVFNYIACDYELPLVNSYQTSRLINGRY